MKTVGDTLGFHKSSVSRIVRVFSQALMAIKKGFYTISGVPALTLISVVYGIHVRIIAPSEHESVSVYSKGFHSINTQAICGHGGERVIF